MTKPILLCQPLAPDLDRFADALGPVWSSHWFSNKGAAHEALEKALLNHLRLKHFSLFNNGTTALMIALRALELEGEVITTPFTFPATTHAIQWNHLTPVFADICPSRLTLSPKEIEKQITDKTSAILGVHVFGMPCYVEEIESIAQKHNLKIIYDAAHCFGTEINGCGIGTFGDLSMFSFHATKLFHCAEGGGLACQSEAMKEKVWRLGNFGLINETDFEGVGVNGKMNEIQASLGLLVLDMVAEERRKRQQVIALYQAHLAGVDGISFLPKLDGVKSSQQYCPVLIDEQAFGVSRDSVFEALRSQKIMARKYFNPLMSRTTVYANHPSASVNNLLQANRIADQVLCLPFYGELTERQIELITSTIISARR